MGYFEGMFITDTYFKFFDCKKSQGFVETDVLNVSSNTINSHLAKAAMLKEYKANIKLKENVYPLDLKSFNLKIHILSLIIRKNSTKRHFLCSSWRSKLTSPTVVLRKTDVNFSISGYYKLGVNNKVCSYSYSLPNIESGRHSLAKMNVFANIDLKTA